MGRFECFPAVEVQALRILREHRPVGIADLLEGVLDEAEELTNEDEFDKIDLSIRDKNKTNLS